MKFTVLPQKPAAKVAKEGAITLVSAMILGVFLRGSLLGAIVLIFQLYGLLMLIAALIIHIRDKFKKPLKAIQETN